MPVAKRILIVDDNPRNLFILEKILAEHYVLRQAASGEEALEICREFLPDLVLLDVMMPGIDGYETCRRMRACDVMSRTKIIMVSAKAMVRERLDGYAAGADDYITKPFNPDELLAKVRVFLELRSLQEVERLRGELITLLRHETSTPLSVILGSADILLQDEALTAEHRELIEMTVKASKRMQRLVERTVVFSQLRDGEKTLEPSPVDLNRVVHGVLQDLADVMARKSVECVATLSGPCTVYLDARFPQYVFATVIENAIEASPEGAKVHIETVHQAEHVVVSVSDEGSGWGPDFAERVFEPFAVKDIQHHQTGTGLGLAIARQLVELHGGVMQAESGESGARILMRLPLAPADMRTAPSGSAPLAGDRKTA